MHRNSGAFLIEIAVAIAVLLIGLLGFFSVFSWNSSSLSLALEQDAIRIALDNVVEELNNHDFQTVRSTYEGQTVACNDLELADGNNASVLINFFTNETTMPAEFGPLRDIDGDGKMETTDCSNTYKLLPARLRLTYQNKMGPRTQDLYVLLGTTSGSGLVTNL